MAPLHSLGQDNQNEVQCDFLVMWHYWHCCWHHQWHHCIPKVKMIEMRFNMTFFIIWYHWHWHWCQLMPKMSSMTPLHFLSQNKVQNIFGHLTTLVPALAPLDVSGVINGTIIFIRWRQLNWDATWLFGYIWYWCQHWYYHCTKGFIIPLNSHLIITNAILSLMAPPASCYCHEKIICLSNGKHANCFMST